MKLLIDDTRNFFVDVIARTYEGGVWALLHNNWQEVYIDFDLGGEQTGLDVLKDGFNLMRATLEAAFGVCYPETITIVSLNPVGRKQIGDFLKDNGYETKDNTTYTKNIN